MSTVRAMIIGRLAGAVLSAMVGAVPVATAAECPAITVSQDRGLAGAHPQQFELAEFQRLANCTLAFSQNPAMAVLNGRIAGNPDLPPVDRRLPAEPLVVAPYHRIGRYGGELRGISKSTEAGTSDLLSVRHVNLVRFSDDLETLVPNVAKAWRWNDDFTELTFTLRKGHKWSDGTPFTAADVAFWFNNLVLDKNVVAKPRDIWMAGGAPIAVTATDDQTVRFAMKAPKPGLLSAIAIDYAQPFQPRHVLGRFHPKINPEADALARAAGFANGYAVINFYYGGSDWKDRPSPYRKAADRIGNLPAAVLPTLESHVVVEETGAARVLVANPYFHMVDTRGNQLPYIDEIIEKFISGDNERLAVLVDGGVDYKAQSLPAANVPALLAGQERGQFNLAFRTPVGMPVVSFNINADDKKKRSVFANRDFRIAMSHAINRAKINTTAFDGRAEERQYTSFDPAPRFETVAHRTHAIAFDQDKARAMLDTIGLRDTDGDGFRNLPDGSPLTLALTFSPEGVAKVIVENLAADWSSVGIKTTPMGVSTKAYRAAQSANKLDVMIWPKGLPAAVLQGNDKLFVPPFGDYFGHRNALMWAKHLETAGKDGEAPPAWVRAMRDEVAAWQNTRPGSDAWNTRGAALIDMQLEQFLFIGIVKPSRPIYRSNRLQNFRTPTTASYAFYWTYPYRAHQWTLAE